MRLLVTAGPTREPMDAVRFISNRSSGRLGIQTSLAALERGHEVTLLLGPVSVPLPETGRHLRIYRFESSAQLQQLLAAHWSDHDGLIMAAAVSDYRPQSVIEGKMARQGAGSLTLTLEPTPDLVRGCAAMRRADQWIIAFSLEERSVLEARASEKMRAKGVDAMVANPLGTMEADDISAWWLEPDRKPEACPRMSKQAFGLWLVEQSERLHERKLAARRKESDGSD